MMRFRGSGRGIKRRRPSSVNRIDLPDFIPLERNEPSHHAQNRNPNYPAAFQDNRKTNSNNNNRFSEERHHQNRRENSGSTDRREKRKHSPITHHSISDQPSKYRSKSPKNIKVIARVRSHPNHNASFSDFGQHQQYEDSRPKRAPIIFDLNDPRRHSQNESNGHPMQMASTSNQQIMSPPEHRLKPPNFLVTLDRPTEYHELLPDSMPDNVHNGRNEDMNMDVLERLETLERDKIQLLGHCNGLRDTVDQYYREISKLEALIHTFSQEIEILQRRIYK